VHARIAVDDLGKPLVCLTMRGGGEDATDRAGDKRLLGPGDVAEHVAQEMDGAALPGAAQHLGDRGLEAGVGVGDAQPHPLQAPGPQAAEELPPEALGLGLAEVQADDLTAAAVVDAVRDHQRLVPDPTRLTHALDLGVQPQIRVGALQGPLPEHPDLLVQATAQP
jgi:hypothetical protein